tara:strand:+ start:73 stop:912 length:840 start_codon:yes stop_codon:yes gene_type:complete
MSSTGVSILGKNGSVLEAINSTSNALKIDIASASSGALTVSDTTAHGKLDTIETTNNAIQVALGSTLSVSDSTTQGKLDTIEITNNAIQSALGGTLTVSDSATQGKLDTIEITNNAIQVAVEALDDIVLVDGSSYSSSSSKGVMLLAKDNSGNFKPVELNGSSELKVTSAGSITSTATQTHAGVSVANSSTSTSSAVDLQTVREVSVIGNVSETGAEIEILVSSDDTNYYKRTDISLMSDYSSGDFGKSFKVNARYLKVKYVNDSGSSRVLSSVVVRKL